MIEIEIHSWDWRDLLTQSRVQVETDDRLEALDVAQTTVQENGLLGEGAIGASYRIID